MRTRRPPLLMGLEDMSFDDDWESDGKAWRAQQPHWFNPIILRRGAPPLRLGTQIGQLQLLLDVHPTIAVLNSPPGVMKGDFSASVTQLSEGECQQRMKEFPLWELASDSRSMSRTFVAKNYAEGLRFFNRIAELADVESGHHPDLHLTDSRTVSLVLFTSAVKGLTIQDFNLARQIDKHTVLYSSKWLRGNPRIIEILVRNQEKDIVSEVVLFELSLNRCDLRVWISARLSRKHLAAHADIKSPDRTAMSGIGELLQVGQDAQGGIPPMQSEQGDVPLLEVEEEDGFDMLEYEWPKLLSDDDLEERLRFLSNWKLSPDRRSIYRTFQARNFSEGITFFNAVAKLAEEEGHPPDLHLTEFRKVKVVLTTQQLQGLSSLDIIMAERINNIDVQCSEPPKDIVNFLQSTMCQEPERSPSQDSEVQQPEDSPQRPVLEVQAPNNSFQQQSSQAVKPRSRKSNRISFTQSNSADDPESDQDTATLLHSLILVYAEAGAGGLSIQEAVRRMRKQGLPGLKERAKTVQVAKITNNHPDFVACDGIGCFALRKSLLKSFQSGALDAEEYANEKKMEATVLEKYASNSSKSVSIVQLPLQPARLVTPTIQKPSVMLHSGIQRRSPVTSTSGHR